MVLTIRSALADIERQKRIVAERGHNGLTMEDIGAINSMREFSHRLATGQVKEAAFHLHQRGIKTRPIGDWGDYEIVDE